MRKGYLCIILFACNAYGMKKNPWEQSEYTMGKTIEYLFSITHVNKSQAKCNLQKTQIKGLVKYPFSKNTTNTINPDNTINLDFEQSIDEFIHFLQELKTHYKKQ